LEITWVGESGVCARDVKDCSYLISIRKGKMRNGRETYLVYCARYSPFVCAGKYSDSSPHTCAWGGAMNLVPPFIEVEALQFDRIFFSRGGPFPQISAVGTWVSMSRPSGAWKRNRTSALSTTLCKEFLCPTLDGGGDVGFKDKLESRLEGCY
jgi:hypothetical protein